MSADVVTRDAPITTGVSVVESFGFARSSCAAPRSNRTARGAEQVEVGNPEHVLVFYLDRELHKKRRAANTSARWRSTPSARRDEPKRAVHELRRWCARLPGWQVALHETRVFIDRLLRIPGVRLERAPDMVWNSPLMSDELRNAIVTCDRA
jgi:hypothetical protein